MGDLTPFLGKRRSSRPLLKLQGSIFSSLSPGQIPPPSMKMSLRACACVMLLFGGTLRVSSQKGPAETIGSAAGESFPRYTSELPYRRKRDYSRPRFGCQMR
jgi:hypothetical protein